MHVGLVQNGHKHLHHLIKIYLVLFMAELKNCSLGLKQQSLTNTQYFVSESLLFNANSAIFQLYHGENKLISMK